jgi:hypothetical protein
LEEFRSRGRANWEFVKQRRVYGFGRVVGELGNRDDIKLDGN